MAKEKKIEWQFGDVFLIPLKNGGYGTGQTLDLQMPNIVRLALYDEVVINPLKVDLQRCCNFNNLISLVSSSREQLDFGVWEIIGNKPINISKKGFPNEELRKKKWIGAIHYDAALLEDFLNSFYGLLPWDDWYDPNYLDKILISIDKKPDNLVYKKSKL